MIYVKRDASQIPEKLLAVAARAQERLETIPAEDRPKFIKQKSHIWRAFARHLSKMSWGKCWYSEADEPQSFFDVDHFRPKLSAKRSDAESDAGYEWLAFSWENFRYTAQRSNRHSKNEDTDQLEGKGDWFPLLEGSPRACWDNRCVGDELPMLLDPVSRVDVRLIDVLDDGRMGSSRTCVGSAKERVERSIEIYGLNLPRLKAARLRVMRDINQLHETLSVLLANSTESHIADRQPITTLCELIHSKTLPTSHFSRAARAQLIRLGAGDLISTPEEGCE